MLRCAGSTLLVHRLNRALVHVWCMGNGYLLNLELSVGHTRPSIHRYSTDTLASYSRVCARSIGGACMREKQMRMRHGVGRE